MAAISKNVDWVSIEGEYRAGVKPVTGIATAHGISHTAINKRAKANGWARDPGATKRQIVEAHFSGGKSSAVSDKVSSLTIETITDAANEDIADMERALRINRHCLLNLEVAAEKAEDPKLLKVIVEATNSAVESIRKIRGLDKPSILGQATTVVTAQRLMTLSDEELDVMLRATGKLVEHGA